MPKSEARSHWMWDTKVKYWKGGNDINILFTNAGFLYGG
jgi:hypothetical protein